MGAVKSRQLGGEVVTLNNSCYDDKINDQHQQQQQHHHQLNLHNSTLNSTHATKNGGSGGGGGGNISVSGTLQKHDLHYDIGGGSNSQYHHVRQPSVRSRRGQPMPPPDELERRFAKVLVSSFE